MKRNYETPEWELVTFNAEELRTASSSCPDDSSCPNDNDCAHCFYLVCQPQDVIIGG